MPTKAKLYIAFVIAMGFAVIADCVLFQPDFANLSRYAILFALAIVGSACKVRLPGITGTISINFLFILVGAADFTFTETVLMGCSGAAVQCVWKARKRPQVAQVLFNVATMAVSIGLAYWIPRLAVPNMGTSSTLVLLTVAASVFFLSNSMLVAMVLSFIEGKPVNGVWRLCYWWSFPYYVAGAAIAAAVSTSGHVAGWGVSLMILPLMYLIYGYYRMYIQRVTVS